MLEHALERAGDERDELGPRRRDLGSPIVVAGRDGNLVVRVQRTNVTVTTAEGELVAKGDGELGWTATAGTEYVLEATPAG